ncbi:hypothetical protein ANANG_G00082370 [Anguilla anguilla]|uniref:ATPase AAA-type core domain-containing protein n=1 Tax=Anguilla anguilla TaxID=7936 RepID=A0A9D3MM57_ANGAN|nr:hypothetical protein ANANG_G00082370 [Anguilla anguilla]
MFSLSTTLQPQVTVPLSHLLNTLHSLKSLASSSIQSLQRERNLDLDLPSSEPTLNLRDLGLVDLRAGQLEELASSLLPRPCFEESPSITPVRHSWRTSHVSTNSFFRNKHGFSHRPGSVFGSPVLCRQSPTPLQAVCSDLQHWSVLIQSRGFKTLKSKTRRLQAGYERPTEPDGYTPAFMKGLLMRDKVPEAESIDRLVKMKNLPDTQHDAFKTGFAEGFLKAQALTQRTQDSLRRTRLILLVLLLLGLYGLSRTPFLSVRFRTTSGLDAAVDPVQMKNVTFEHVKGVEEAKNELLEVVEFLRSPQKFTVLGGKLPKGILLVGPQALGRPCWHGLWQERRMFHSTMPPVPSLTKCSWAWGPAASETSSGRPKPMRRV